MSDSFSATPFLSDQWIRRWSLVVYDAAGKNVATQISGGSDVPGQEQLRIIFDVKQTTGPVPNICTVKFTIQAQI